MTSRLVSLSRSSLLLLALLALAACSQQPETASPAADATATTAATPTTTEGGTPATMPVEAKAPRTPGPIVAPTGPAPVAGTDYMEIAGGQPFQGSPGKIEVAEAFGYTCPHCAEFEPLVSAWAAKLPADVEFHPVAAPFGGYWVPYAKAFYTAQAMGIVEKTHEAMFSAIHLENRLPVQPLPTDDQLADFYAQYGADPGQFKSTMNSFAINAKLGRATQFLQRSGVESTPNLVVNGKYRVVGKSFDDQLRIADHLIAKERAEMAPAADAEAADVPEAEADADAGAAAANG